MQVWAVPRAVRHFAQLSVPIEAPARLALKVVHCVSDLGEEATEHEYEQALKVLLNEKYVSGVIVSVLPYQTTPLPGIIESLEAVSKKHPQKPVMVILPTGCQKNIVQDLDSIKVPFSDSIEIAVKAMDKLHKFFNQEKTQRGLKSLFVYSKSAIQCAIIPGNEKVKSIAAKLQEKGFDVKAILSPTVPEGQERLRFCLHSYNSEEEISNVLQLLSNFVF